MFNNTKNAYETKVSLTVSSKSQRDFHVKYIKTAEIPDI